MARPRPITQADYDQVRKLHGQGLSRNEIARRTGRGQRTVSRLAAEMGLTFERAGTTAKATEAKKADAATRRAKLQLDALAGAQKLMAQMFEPALVYNFGGKENDYNQRTLDEPPFRDKQAIALSIQALANTALRLAEYDKAAGSDDEKGMLLELRDQLRAARDQAKATG